MVIAERQEALAIPAHQRRIARAELSGIQQTDDGQMPAAQLQPMCGPIINAAFRYLTDSLYS